MKCAYIYYRIDPAQEALAAGRIEALLGRMAEHCSQPPQRLARCDDPVTWMEIYEDIGDFSAFAAALDEAIQAFDCAAFTLGERHLECFSRATSGAQRSQSTSFTGTRAASAHSSS